MNTKFISLGDVDAASKPSSWAPEDDEVRVKLSSTMVSFVSAQTMPLTIGLDGVWGSGKTYFLRRFETDYANSGGSGACIYLNAWERDFLHDPLLYLFSGLDEFVTSNPDYASIDDFSWEVCKKNIVAIAKGGLSAVLHMATNGASDKVMEGLDACSDAIDKHPLSLYREQTHSVDAIKKYLTKLGNKVREATGRPLVLIVDELDRCRPTYAIEMLERIKHLFNIPNIVFVLGLDFVQLGKSIRSLYGEIDTGNYLHRMIQYRFSLSALPIDMFVRTIAKRDAINTLVWKSKPRYPNEPTSNDTLAFKVFCWFAKFYGISLRQIERAIGFYRMSVVSPQQSSLAMAVFAMTSILKVQGDGLDKLLVDDSAEDSIVADILDEKGSSNKQDSSCIRGFLTYLIKASRCTGSESAGRLHGEYYTHYQLSKARQPIDDAFGPMTVELLLRALHAEFDNKYIDFGDSLVNIATRCINLQCVV